jgi:hypothetical protein
VEAVEATDGVMTVTLAAEVEDYSDLPTLLVQSGYKLTMFKEHEVERSEKQQAGQVAHAVRPRLQVVEENGRGREGRVQERDRESHHEEHLDVEQAQCHRDRRDIANTSIRATPQYEVNGAPTGRPPVPGLNHVPVVPNGLVDDRCQRSLETGRPCPAPQCPTLSGDSGS